MSRILPVLLVAAALLIALRLRQDSNGPLVVSGFVEADQIRLGSRVGGRVKTVHVREGQRVITGEALLELEPFDLAEKRAVAQAEEASAERELERLEAGFRPEEVAQAAARRDGNAAKLARLVKGPREQELATGRAQVELAEAKLELAGQEHDRAARLFAQEVASEELLDRATSNLKVAQATLVVWRQELALLEEGSREEDIAAARAELAEASSALELLQNGYREEDVGRASAALDAARAALAAIDTQLAELVLRAPMDGVVEALELQPGDLVPRDAPALSLIDPSHLWVRAYVPEGRLTIQPGDEVWVAVDPWPEERFRARVGFISRQAEFTPGNVQTPEERSKQVFRIKVDLEQGLDRLRPGMSADVFLEPED